MIPHCGFSSGWPREPLPLSQILVGVTQGAWLHLAAAEAERLYPGPQSLIFDLYPAPAPFAPLLRSVVAAALDLQAGGGGPRAPQGTAWGTAGGQGRFRRGRRGAFGSHRLFIVPWQGEGVCRAWALGAGAGKAPERLGRAGALRGAPEARGQ